jgi:predicted O-methyltransferase YrrM
MVPVAPDGEPAREKYVPSADVAAATASDLPLSDWIEIFAQGPGYKNLVKRFRRRANSDTPPEETAMMYAIIQRLRPEWCLEIGTLFAHTTRLITEAVVDADVQGKVITLDPFGGERIPEILGSWPHELQAVVQFLPYNSMQYFLELETLGTAKGKASPLGVAFVDGHHNFEYALYDIIRSADHLRPGGAIIVDNLEQDGPRSAVARFLRWNPAWRIYFQNRVSKAAGFDESLLEGISPDKVSWGVLLSPDGIQVARHSVKFLKRGITADPIQAIRMNIRDVTSPGVLSLNVSYYAVPFDFHVTGKGMSHLRTSGKIDLPGKGGNTKVAYSPPLKLDIEKPEATNVCYEIEAVSRPVV